MPHLMLKTRAPWEGVMQSRNRVLNDFAAQNRPLRLPRLKKLRPARRRRAEKHRPKNQPDFFKKNVRQLSFGRGT